MADHLSTARLAVRSTPHPLAPTAITITLDAARKLDTDEAWDFTVEELPFTEITADVPNVAPEKLAHLDDQGIARVGSVVEPGTILVGRTRAQRSPLEQSPEVRELDKLFGAKPGLADASHRCPPTVSGRVIEAACKPKTKKSPAHATVTVEDHRPLTLGDALELDDGRRGVVGAIVPDLDGADLAWPGVAGELDVHKVSCARDRLHARHIGPYSLVTQQPLADPASFGGQRVGEAELEALHTRGATWLAWELMTVKSDDIKGRMKLYESIVMGTPECVPTISRATQCLEHELKALCFDVDFSRAQVSIHLHDDASLRQLALGVVTKPDTLNYRTHKPERGGLFCEEIFGDLSDPNRGDRLGRIELAAPVLHPWAVRAVALLLGLPESRVEAVAGCETTLAGAEPESREDIGGVALRRALSAIDLDAIGPDGDRGHLASALRSSNTRPASLCFEVWPVLPPDLRPLVPLDGGRWATSDLNDLYRRLINRNNRTRRLIELNAPEIIIRNELRFLQQAVDALVENGARGPTITGPNHRPLVSLAELVQGERGRFRLNLLGKRVDYSGVAAAVPRSDVGDMELRLPRRAAIELFRPWVFANLERAGHVNTIKGAKQLVEAKDPRGDEALLQATTGYPVVLFPEQPASPCPVTSLDVALWDEPAIGLSPMSFAALGLQPGDRVIVHVPVDPRAVTEARERLRVPVAARAPGPEQGWLQRAASADRVGPVLFAAALSGEIDSATSDRARLILGRRIE